MYAAVSGGQTGADCTALDFANEHGNPQGAGARKGWMAGRGGSRVIPDENGIGSDSAVDTLSSLALERTSLSLISRQALDRQIVEMESGGPPSPAEVCS